jgi:hypothetical protein
MSPIFRPGVRPRRSCRTFRFLPQGVLAMKSALCVSLAVVLAAGSLVAAEIKPFNGKDLSNWSCKGKGKEGQTATPADGKWSVGVVSLDKDKPNALKVEPGGDGAAMACEGRGRDIYTNESFGDCTIELELMVAKGSNSGIYLMGEYEIQVLDSFGRQKIGPGDMGGVYGTKPADVNACKAPGEWQKYVIEFQAPKFEGENKVSNAKLVKVTLNDQVIHENVEITKSTGGALKGKESATGPLMFQGDHGPAAYRNIVVRTK